MKRLALALAAALMFGIAPASAGIVNVGGTARTVLTATSPTACTSIESNPNGAFGTLINTGPAMTVYPQFYDEGANPTCSATDLIYGNGTTIALGVGQVITFNLPLFNGLAYRLSGPLTSNLIVAFQ